MGVLACSRVDCKNIMCDDSILGGKYYICTDCLKELRLAAQSLEAGTSQAAIVRFINNFMSEGFYGQAMPMPREDFEKTLDHSVRD